MSYSRKQFEKRKLKKLSQECAGWCGGSYYNKDKKRYIRFWKSQGKNSIYAILKRAARKKSRLYAKKNDFYTKNADDLKWNVW